MRIIFEVAGPLSKEDMEDLQAFVMEWQRRIDRRIWQEFPGALLEVEDVEDTRSVYVKSVRLDA